MKARVFALLPLFAVGCISIPIGTGRTTVKVPVAVAPSPAPSASGAPQTQTQTPAMTDTVSQIPDKLMTPAMSLSIAAAQGALVEEALGRVRADGDAELRQAPIIGASITGAQLLRGDEAARTVTNLKTKLLGEFRGPQYAGLRPELEAAVGQEWESRLEFQQTALGQRGVLRSSVESVVGTLFGLVREVFRRPDKLVTFHVLTEPSGAIFQICPQYLNEGCFPITTNGDIAGIFRGYYTYRIRLVGHKPVQFDLNLVNFGRQRLRCILRRNEDPAEAGPCTPE